jgi:hypothetical protein
MWREIVYVKKPQYPAPKSRDEGNVNFFLNTVTFEVFCEQGSFLENGPEDITLRIYYRIQDRHLFFEAVWLLHFTLTSRIGL